MEQKESILVINSDIDAITDKDCIREFHERLSHIEKILKIVVKRKVKGNEKIINK